MHLEPFVSFSWVPGRQIHFIYIKISISAKSEDTRCYTISVPLLYVPIQNSFDDKSDLNNYLLIQ